MIVTFTANPSVDRTAAVEGFFNEEAQTILMNLRF